MRVLATVTLALLLSGCSLWPWKEKVVTPPAPANVASAPALKTAATEQQSKASAAVEAATVANQGNADGAPKVAVAGELSVAAANLPPPGDKDKAEALARVNAALRGDLQFANGEWSKARNEASVLTEKVRALEAKVEAERHQAALELQRQLQAVRDEANQKAAAKERFWLTMIFFGGGALCLAGAAAILFLGASVPFFGPKAGLAVGAAGAVLIMTGIAVRSISNFIDAHPYLFFGGLLLTFAGLAVAGALMVANHHHHSEKAP